MNKAELIPYISKSWLFVKAVGVDELFSAPVALEASDTFKALAVSPDISYEELYLAGLRDGQYNILLSDFSFFQFGIGGSDGVRFAYYPNPFLGTAPDALAELQEMQEYVVEGIIDVDEFLHRISEIRRPQHPPLVRYEYSKEQYVESTHPCSHMHIGFHGENRWPVQRYLTAPAFTMLVLRLFYLRAWMAAGPIKVGEDELSLDALLERARSECRILYDDEFSAAEKKRFHFS